jgi:GNAT superfamily N-acetyltransferase
MAGKRKKPQTVDTVVTFLEMSSDPHCHVHPPANMRVALMHVENVPVHYYRYLYDTVGDGHHWVDRRKLGDDALSKEIHGEGIDLFVAYVDGAPAGYFELDSRREANCVWLAYFGVMGDYQGRGLGKWLLSEAITTAWAKEPESVKVETCTLDHPQALPLYQRMGFTPYERREKTMELL